jgi:hypothetical protein
MHGRRVAQDVSCAGFARCTYFGVCVRTTTLKLQNHDSDSVTDTRNHDTFLRRNPFVARLKAHDKA